jgi:hypothetical protein
VPFGLTHYKLRPGIINGGHRIAVVWDEWSGDVLDYVDVLVNRDITFTIDADGKKNIQTQPCRRLNRIGDRAGSRFS